MTSRERMRKTLTFNYPDRLPRDLWILPIAFSRYEKEIETILKKFPLDIGWPESCCLVEKKYTKGSRFEKGAYVDEWGCTFQNVHGGIIGQVKNPLVKSLSEVSKVRPPYKFLEEKMQKIIEIEDKKWKAADKFTLGGSFSINPFERMQFLRGTPQLYMDIVDGPPEFFKLRDKVHQYNLKELELWAKTNVDGILFADDWGSQSSLLIHPELWRKLFKPLYKDYCDVIHSSGKFAFMHSDGYIFDIYEDLIEIGVDAINSQLFCMDIENIGRKFKGKITFWGEIDRQHVLPADDSRKAREAVEEIKQFLYNERGGVIAQCSFEGGGRPENIEAVFSEWERV